LGAGGTAFGVGAKASAKSERETLSRDGDASMCAKATLDDTNPPRWCGAVVRVEVVPVARALRSTLNEAVDREARARTEVETTTLPELPVASIVPPPRIPPRRAQDAANASAFLSMPGERARPTKPPPEPCDGSSVSDCMARCADGSGPSCLTLAHARGKDQTYWLLSACMAGIAEGCTGVGKAYARGEFGSPDELTAEKWYGIAAHVRP
jgi:hypothetical protein